MKKEQIQSAAKQFISLYSEEIENGEEITGSAIHEWWVSTVDQYSELTMDDFESIESAINKMI
jgi:hypothetical protein